MSAAGAAAAIAGSHGANFDGLTKLGLIASLIIAIILATGIIYVILIRASSA